MKHKIVLFCLSLLMVHCGRSQSGGVASLAGGDSSFGGASGGSGSGGGFAIDPVQGVDNLKKAVSLLPTENPKQKTAVDSAQKALTTARNAYKALRRGMGVEDLRRFAQLMDLFRKQASKAAEDLREADFPPLAEVFKKMAQKIDVMRFYHPVANTFAYAAASQANLNAGVSMGYLYQGVGFYVYQTDRADSECRLPLYACAYGNDQFLSNSSSCEGQTMQGPMGFVCAKKTDARPYVLTRLWNVDTGYRLSTINPDEIQYVLGTGKWSVETYQGYPPF